MHLTILDIVVLGFVWLLVDWVNTYVFFWLQDRAETREVSRIEPAVVEDF